MFCFGCFCFCFLMAVSVIGKRLCSQRNNSSFPGALQRWRLCLYDFFGYHHNNIHYAYLAIQAVLDSALEVGIYFNFTEGKFLLNSKRRKCESKNKLIKF